MEKTFGKRLQAARLAAGFATAEGAAQRYGWKLNTYRSHESGARIPRDAQRYARAYKVREEWLILNKGDMKDSIQKAEHTPKGHKSSDIQPMRESNFFYPDNVHDVVPLYGPASAGLEKVYITENNMIGMRPRPPELHGVKDGFRMLVKGDCMDPRHRDGEEVSVHPFHKPVIGGDCVVIMEPDGDAQVKVYLGDGPKEVRLGQINPRKEFLVSKKEIRRILAVVR